MATLTYLRVSTGMRKQPPARSVVVYYKPPRILFNVRTNASIRSIFECRLRTNGEKDISQYIAATL